MPVFASLLFAILPLQNPPSLTVGMSAPPISAAKWLRGAPMVAVPKGKVAIFSFWSPFSEPSVQSLAHIGELAARYKGKAQFVAVAVRGPRTPYETFAADCDAWLKKLPGEYSLAVDGKEGVMAKTWMAASGQAGVLPCVVAIDRNGKLAWTGHPMGLERIVSRLVAGTFDAKAEEARQEKLRNDARAQSKSLEGLLAKLKAGDHPGAVAEIDRLMAADPGRAAQLGLTRFGELVHYDAAAAQRYALELGEGTYKDVAPALAQMVRLVVQPNSEIKEIDSPGMLRLAQRAVELTKGEDASCMETLSLALYRAGRLDDAITNQRKAIALAEAAPNPDAGNLKSMRENLDMLLKARG